MGQGTRCKVQGARCKVQGIKYTHNYPVCMIAGNPSMMNTGFFMNSVQ